MNILIVTREFPPSKRSGGIGSYSKDLATGLGNLGHTVVVLAASDNVFNSSYKKTKNYELYRISGGDFFIGRSILARSISKLRDIFLHNSFRKKILKKILELDKKYSFDIIEIPDYGNEGKYWLQKKYIPTVMRFHSPTFTDRKNELINPTTKHQIEEFNAFKLVEAHSFVSKSLMNMIYKFNVDYTNIISRVIHNSVFVPKFQNKKTFSQDNFLIIGAGTISSLKGFDRLVNACEIIYSKGFNFKLELYGREGDLSYFMKKKSKSNNWLKLYGQVDRSILLNKFFEADLCCFPSYFEPMGLTALEAMGVGSIVLAGSSGGWSEIINDSKNGFLISPKSSIEELATKIISILCHSNHFKKNISKNAQSTIKEKSMDKFLRETISLYKDSIKEYKKNMQ